MLSKSAASQALSDIGKGEIGGNNRGPYVWSLTGRRTSGAWCAAAVHTWFERAAAQLGRKLPWRRSHGARRLAKRIAAAGQWISKDQQPHVGDVAVWSRGRLPWQGHVGIVVESSADGFFSVEGNVGRYPALVRRFPHTLAEPRLLGFARPPSDW
jgi:hypothetical protein